MPLLRECDQCHVKLPPFKPRTRDESGALLCDGCHPDKKGSPSRPIDVHAALHCDACAAPIGDAGLTVTAGRLTCGDGCKTAASYPRANEWMKVEGYGEIQCVDPADENGMVGCRNAEDPPGEATFAVNVSQVQQVFRRQSSLQRVAHDSGDGATIYHCFEGSTRYWTKDGIKTLAETVDTVQQVLTNYGSGGVWRDAIIHSFGEQRLWAVTLRRNKQTKVIHATADHRWLVRTRTNDKRTDHTVVATADLLPEQRLSWLLPQSALGTSTPSPFGIAHGVTFGDGTRANKGSVVRLWGDKDAQLLRYFSESRLTPVKTANGVLGQMVLDLPAFFKDRPSLDKSVPYLYGWLAGYFAADGSVSKQGQAVLHSASKETLEFVQVLAARLGIGTYDIVSRTRRGYGDPSLLHQIQFIGSTLRPEFFLTREHRARYEAVVERGNTERIGWTVVSVEQTDRVEEVFCPRVPDTENFVLESWINTANCPFCGAGQVTARSDGTVECGFCKNFFTVQVQPNHAAMPQTDPTTGKPLNMPGMPGDPATHEAPTPAPVAEDPNFAPEGAGGEQGFAPAGTKGAQFLPAGTGNHVPQQVAASRKVAWDNDEWDEAHDDHDGVDLCTCCGGSGEHDNGRECYYCDATGKESLASGAKCSEEKTSAALYLTPDGVAIPEQSYLAHLALRFADDRDAVLTAVRNERTAR